MVGTTWLSCCSCPNTCRSGDGLVKEHGSKIGGSGRYWEAVSPYAEVVWLVLLKLLVAWNLEICHGVLSREAPGARLRFGKCSAYVCSDVSGYFIGIIKLLQRNSAAFSEIAAVVK